MLVTPSITGHDIKVILCLRLWKRCVKCFSEIIMYAICCNDLYSVSVLQWWTTIIDLQNFTSKYSIQVLVMNWPLPHLKLLDDLSFLLLVCSLQLFWAVYTSDKGRYTYDVHKIFVLFDPLPPCHVHSSRNLIPFVCFFGTPSPHPLRTSYKYAPQGGRQRALGEELQVLLEDHPPRLHGHRHGRTLHRLQQGAHLQVSRAGQKINIWWFMTQDHELFFWIWLITYVKIDSKFAKMVILSRNSIHDSWNGPALLVSRFKIVF